MWFHGCDMLWHASPARGITVYVLGETKDIPSARQSNITMDYLIIYIYNDCIHITYILHILHVMRWIIEYMELVSFKVPLHPQFQFFNCVVFSHWSPLLESFLSAGRGCSLGLLCWGTRLVRGMEQQRALWNLSRRSVRALDQLQNWRPWMWRNLGAFSLFFSFGGLNNLTFHLWYRLVADCAFPARLAGGRVPVAWFAHIPPWQEPVKRHVPNSKAY